MPKFHPFIGAEPKSLVIMVAAHAVCPPKPATPKSYRVRSPFVPQPDIVVVLVGEENASVGECRGAFGETELAADAVRGRAFGNDRVWAETSGKQDGK